MSGAAPPMTNDEQDGMINVGTSYLPAVEKRLRGAEH